VNIETTVSDQVALVRLHRPEVLNALSLALMEELADRLTDFDRDPDVRVIVLTGDERAFAAGADIKEMADATPVEMIRRDQFARWDAIRRVKKPLIAAVSGYALGGGLELAMACDIIVAAESARFGQPEIKIGVMPGAGGTQILPRLVGMGKAMEMVLTGRPISAREAERLGLVTRVVPDGLCLDEALALAREIAAMPPLAVQHAKEAIRRSALAGVDLAFERKNFTLLFGSEDQREGMAAFLEKRPPRFTGR
jgi:enoyl-CoA hydratase